MMSAQLFNVVVGFVSGALAIIVAEWALDWLRSRSERIRLAKSFIADLKGISESFSDFGKYELIGIKETPIFDALLPKILLFKEETIESVLLTYSKIKFQKLVSSDVKGLQSNIEDTIKLLEKEMN